MTYECNKRVIQGYTTPKGEEVPGLTGNTLRYYKTDFISRDRTPRNMRALVTASTDLLCIKNDVYKETKLAGQNINPKIARYFAEGDRSMLVIYDERAISAIAEILETVEPGKEKIKVYVFSAGSYAYDDEFEEVADKVELCACRMPSIRHIKKSCPNDARSSCQKPWKKTSVATVLRTGCLTLQTRRQRHERGNE